MSLAKYQEIIPNLFAKSQDQQAGDLHTISEDLEETITTQADDLTEKREREKCADITQLGNFANAEIYFTSTWRKAHKGKKLEGAKKLKKYPVIIRRIVETEGHRFPSPSQFEIQSTTLCEMIRNIVEHSYAHSDFTSTPIIIPFPFYELFFYRKEIESAVDPSTMSATVFQEWTLIRGFLEEPTFSSIITEHENNCPEGFISYSILWTIYPPDQLVVVKLGDFQECWVCRDFEYEKKQQQWLLTGWGICFDGAQMRLEVKKYLFPLFSKPREKIHELEVVPIAFWTQEITLKEKLLSRGKLIDELFQRDSRGYAHMSFEGCGWSRRNFGVKQEIRSRVILDFAADIEMEGARPMLVDENVFKDKSAKTGKPDIRGLYPGRDRDWGGEMTRVITNRPFTRLDGRKMKGGIFHYSGLFNKGTLRAVRRAPYIRIFLQYYGSYDVRLLYPARVPVYVLGEKKWMWVLFDELKDIEWDSASFNTPLPRNTEHLFKTLVAHYLSKKSVNNDLLRQGQGLVFLFHGSLEIEKTITAEMLAEYLETPFCLISAVDLGTTAVELSTKLESIAKLTANWNAIILFDAFEAFIAKRSAHETERNVLVTAFLQALQYFKGVLIFTTNRTQKEDIDEVFRSRVDMTIEFPPLTAKMRTKIWQELVLGKGEGTLQVENSWRADKMGIFELLGKFSLHSRMIKNILRVSYCYADAVEETHAVSHVNEVLRVQLSDDISQQTVKEIDDWLAKNA